MHKVTLSQEGTIVIPTELLQKLNLQEAEELVCEERNGDLVLSTKLGRICQAQELFQEWFPTEPGCSLLDELIAEGRAEVNSAQRAGSR